VDDGSLPPVGPLPGASRLVSMNGEDLWAGNPAISPNGTLIAFSAGMQEDDEVDNAWGIYVANADGSGVSLVLAGCAVGGACYDLTDPSWSPDRSQILFTRRPSGVPFDFEVWTMDAAGTNVLALITSGGLDALARWKR